MASIIKIKLKVVYFKCLSIIQNIFKIESLIEIDHINIWWIFQLSIVIHFLIRIQYIIKLGKENSYFTDKYKMSYIGSNKKFSCVSN